jgi:hypothetical protein
MLLSEKVVQNGLTDFWVFKLETVTESRNQCCFEADLWLTYKVLGCGGCGGIKNHMIVNNFN